MDMSYSRREQRMEIRDELARDRRAEEIADTRERLRRWCIQWQADNSTIGELVAVMKAETDVEDLTDDELEAVAEEAATQVSEVAIHLLVKDHRSNDCPMCALQGRLDALDKSH